MLSSQSLNLIVKNLDGTEKSVPLLSLNKITFQDTDMKLTYSDLTTELFALNSIRNMIFGAPTRDITKIAPVLTVYPNPAKDFIFISNLSAEQSLSIYSSSGALLKQLQVSEDQGVDVRDLTRGFYFIKLNNRTIKFVKL